MLAQALVASGGDIDTFTRKFASELRWWLCGLPAGTGLATARAIFKLWLGFSPKKSGVFSAGNGSAMRTAVIAAYFPDDPVIRRQFAEAHTKITHSDPKATTATIAITEIAATLLHANSLPEEGIILSILRAASQPNDPEWEHIIDSMHQGWKESVSLPDFLNTIGGNAQRGITGYAYQTVPAVIYAGFQSKWDFQKTITSIISAGGDTDTTAAIAGALCGAYGGAAGIPQEWVSGIKEWPVSIKKISTLSKAINKHTPLRIRSHWSPALLLRNIFFLITVLTHGFLRLIPTRLRRSGGSI